MHAVDADILLGSVTYIIIHQIVLLTGLPPREKPQIPNMPMTVVMELGFGIFKLNLTYAMEIVELDSKISWTVAVACACMNLLISIPAKVGGLLFVEILDRYQISRNLAGYPAYTITLMRCSGAPFAGYFVERFGVNEMMIIGSLLSAAGISVCFFVEDISGLIIFIGLIHGFGVAFNNSLLPQIVKVHFKKHLTLAYGMTQAGGSLGGVFAPPFLLWIFRTYGTSGGFLIIGAVILNSLPLVMILNILSPDKFYGKSGYSMKSRASPEYYLEMGVNTTVTSSEGEDDKIIGKIVARKEDVKTREKNSDSEIQYSLENKAVDTLNLNTPTNDHFEVVPNKPDGVSLSELNMFSSPGTKITSETRKNQMEFMPVECGTILGVKSKNIIHEKEMKSYTNKKVDEVENNLQEVLFPISDIQPKFLSIREENQQFSNVHTYSTSESEQKVEINNMDFLKQVKRDAEDNNSNKESKSDTFSCNLENNILVTNYLVHREGIPQQRTKETVEILSLSHAALNTRSLENINPRNEEINQKELLKTYEYSTLESTIAKNEKAKESLTIFLDVTFWIVIITQSFLIFSYVIVWNTVIDFSRDKNIDRSKEVYLLMTLPILEIIGRVGLGWIIDRNYLTRINFCILSFLVLGFSCSLMALAQGFFVVMASISVFGIISGGLIAVFPMIIFEFFDSDKHTMGQASRYCLFGPLSFLNSPLIGYFRGTLGSYAWLYHTIAMISIACGALSASIPLFARMREEKKERNKRSSKFHETIKKKNYSVSSSY
ncbi:unnamed protein product [Larinioides sclopetarius]|uniref:Uncharacterized protein n=1 Tax=Larinioides sclopetarius TaxID=280406 RepID=A0AAV1ZPX7_9ARAC